MKGWLVISLIVIVLGAASCNDKLACSAYQSYFVLDNVNYPRNGYPLERAKGLSASRFDYPDISYHEIENPIREQYYSYLDTDSFPKVVDVEKDEFGIVKKRRLAKRERDLGKIPMEVVIPQAPDSILYAGDEQLLAELDLVDSTAIDSVRSLGRSYQYNLDQKYYLWYLRNKLVWKDELTNEKEGGAPVEQEAPAIQGEEGGAQKEGFFKRILGKLFKKKEKDFDPAVDEIPPDNPDEKEENPNDGF